MNLKKIYYNYDELRHDVEIVKVRGINSLCNEIIADVCLLIPIILSLKMRVNYSKRVKLSHH